MYHYRDVLVVTMTLQSGLDSAQFRTRGVSWQSAKPDHIYRNTCTHNKKRGSIAASPISRFGLGKLFAGSAAVIGDDVHCCAAAR
jgi:hypothetical protein